MPACSSGAAGLKFGRYEGGVNLKIAKLETIKAPEHQQLMWLRIYTDEGFIGLGETRPRPESVRALIHEVLSGMLIGRDPRDIEGLWNDMFRALNFHGWAGTEIRAISLVDMALWDILGKVCGQPLHRMLGGRSRSAVPIYNTCVGFGSYDDRNRFLDDPAGLAQELLREGIRGMKVWPFDDASVASGGNSITLEELKKGLAVFEKIRSAVGDQIEIALEGHGCWNLPTGIKIARAVEPYRPWWLEDIIPSDNLVALQQFRAATRIPLCISERLFTRYQLLPVLQNGLADVIISDVCWVGGVTEFRKVAALAATYQVPLAPHNCGGPVQMHVSAQVCTHIPNLMVLETVRAFHRSYHGSIVTRPARIENGYVYASEEPGIGAELLPEFLSRPDLSVQVSAAGRQFSFCSGDPWKNKDAAGAP